MLDVIARFPDSEYVQGTALALFFTRRGDREVDDESGATVTALMAAFTERWPESKIMWAAKVTPEDPDAFAQQIRDLAKSTAGRHENIVAGLEMYAAGRFPFGIVANAAGRTVLEALLERLGFVVVACAVDPSERDAGRQAATAALDGVVSIDLPAAFVANLDDTRWETVLAAFRRIVVADTAVQDVRGTVANLGLDRGGYLGFDAFTDRPTVTDNDAEVDAARRAKAEAILERLQGLDAAASTRLPRFEGFDDRRDAVWLGPLQVAADRQIALYSDDLALRRVATSIGVPSFGTADLIEALHDTGRIDLAERDAWLAVLHGERVVDVVTDVAALLGSGASRAVAAATLSRLWLWQIPGAVRDVLRHFDASGDDEIALASYWFAVGACRFQPAGAERLCADRIVELMSGLSTARHGPASIEAMRRACVERGVDDPLPAAVLQFRDGLAKQVSRDEATRLTLELFAGVDSGAQQVVLRTLALQ